MTALNLAIMETIDREYTDHPYYGSRRIQEVLRRAGYSVSRGKVVRLMRKMGIRAIYQTPRTTIPAKENKTYPYLLKGLTIDHPNQVWSADITYVPMEHGFMYLFAIIDWFSRKIVAWSLSNTLDTSFCVEAVKEAVAKYGAPEILNTDQGCQFTSAEFTGLVESYGIRVSMDGRNRWRDNVIIERFWRTIKYECLYLNKYDNPKSLYAGIANWMQFYNEDRPHQSLANKAPNAMFAA